MYEHRSIQYLTKWFEMVMIILSFHQASLFVNIMSLKATSFLNI